jgi:hypothetical protein
MMLSKILLKILLNTLHKVTAPFSCTLANALSDHILVEYYLTLQRLDSWVLSYMYSLIN